MLYCRPTFVQILILPDGFEIFTKVWGKALFQPSSKLRLSRDFGNPCLALIAFRSHPVVHLSGFNKLYSQTGQILYMVGLPLVERVVTVAGIAKNSKIYLGTTLNRDGLVSKYIFKTVVVLTMLTPSYNHDRPTMYKI